MTVQSRFRFGRPAVGLTGLVTSVLALSSPAFAQAPAASDAGSEGIQTVMVTANKRSENMQKVPVAVAAITAEQAAKIGVVNGQSLAQTVPGLMLNRQTNGTQAFLRGVGTSSTQSGNEPAVALYVDDVYMGSSALQLGNYNSISRIEVLKGPQGTLFGRNATGGVIQVFTRDPKAEPSVEVNLGYATYNTLSGSVYATGALSSNVNANIHAYSEKQSDGWGHNFTTGHPTYLEHARGFKAKLEWNIGDATTVLFSGDHDDYYNQQAVYFRPAPGTVSGAGATSIPPPGRYDTNEALDPEASVKQSGGSVKITHDFANMQLKSVSAYRQATAVQDFEQDGASIYRQNPKLTYRTKTYTEELQLASGTGARMPWVAGLFFLKDESNVDPFIFRGLGAGGTAPNFLTFLGAHTQQKTDSWAAFAQTTYPMLDDRAHITAGLRYSNDKRSLNGDLFNRDANGVETIRVTAANNGKSDSWASTTARLVLDYQVTDQFMAYVGFNKGFKSGLFNTIFSPGGSQPTLAAWQTAMVAAANGRLAGTQYQRLCVNDGNTYYNVNAPASFPAPIAPCIDPPVKPEEIKSYTVGFKSQWFDNRLRINSEAFYYDYKNLQLQTVLQVPGSILTTTLLTNAAAATIKGVEFDVTYKPVEQLTLNASFQLMEGRYDDFPNGQFFVTNPNGGNCAFTATFNGVLPTCGGRPIGAIPPNYVPGTATTLSSWNLKGMHTVQTPPFSANVTATYDVPMKTNGDLSFTVHFSHTGNYWAEPSNGLGQVDYGAGTASRSNPLNEKQLSVDLVNASAKWTSASEKYGVLLWGKNLTDEKYWAFANSTATVTKQIPNAPRTYGVSFSAKF